MADIVFDTIQYFEARVADTWTTLCSYTPTVTPKAILVFFYGGWISGLRYGGQALTLLKESFPGSSALQAYQLVDPPTGEQLLEAKVVYDGQDWRGCIMAIENGHAAGQVEADAKEGWEITNIGVTLAGQASTSKLLSLFFGEVGAL